MHTASSLCRSIGYSNQDELGEHAPAAANIYYYREKNAISERDCHV